ncbi:MAG: HAD family phosphatase [Lachnospiraceae bacterium]|nr:HAD family phosphatase [Lachnospiraceae bacterium]
MQGWENVRMVCCDLDGTLLLEDHESVSGQVRGAIEEVTRRGILFVPTTGRAFNRIPGSVRSLPGVRYLITSNGAEVWDLSGTSVLHGDYFRKDVLFRLLDYLDSLQVGWAVSRGTDTILDRKWRDYFLAHDRGDVLFRGFMRMTVGAENTRRLLEEDAAKVHKIIISELTKAQIETIHQALRNWDEVCMAEATDHNMEITVSGVTKFSGICALCDHTGIPMSEVLAIGDSNNDLTMLRGAGFSAAMENGTREAKAAAQLTAASNEEDGVARVLEQLAGESFEEKTKQQS